MTELRMQLEQWTVDAVISGAQTGADRGGLDAGRALGIKIGGWVPRGRRAEDGVVPAEYPVTELESSDYPTRTTANIQGSDATVIFYWPPLRGGSRLTQRECVRWQKPCLCVNLEWADQAIEPGLHEWLSAQAPRVLNVAGTRESRRPGTQARVARLLVAVLGGACGQKAQAE